MRFARTTLFVTSLTFALSSACSSPSSGGPTTGGVPSTGGVKTGGTSSGGTGPSTGGALTGGVPSTGGSNATGGAPATGGTNASGSAPTTGGVTTGGQNNGGNTSGGNTSGGSGGGQTGGASSGGTGGTQAGASGRFPCPSVAAGTNPVPSGATPTVVAGAPPPDTFNNDNNDFKILEGPVWYNDALYLSEIKNGMAPPASRVLKVTSTGAVSVAIAPEMAGTNGLATDGVRLLGANHTLGAIVRLDPSGASAPTVIVGTYENARFNSPNDLTVRSDGNIYFTDPQHQAGSTRMNQRVYRVAPGASTATVVQDNANAPNGITLSLDESTLFVSHGPDSGGIDKYPVMADGSLGAMANLTPSFNSDGMAIDCAGNLYLSQQSKIVIISSTTGQMVGEIPVTDVQATTNTAFGGPDHKTLYITSLGNNAKLLKIELSVPGLPY